jgi:hypothetical protein
VTSSALVFSVLTPPDADTRCAVLCFGLCCAVLCCGPCLLQVHELEHQLQEATGASAAHTSQHKAMVALGVHKQQLQQAQEAATSAQQQAQAEHVAEVSTSS